MLNNNEIIPSNPPRKITKKKAEPVYDDDDFINDYENDIGDFEQELINKQKNKLKIPRSLNQNELDNDDEEDYTPLRKKVNNKPNKTTNYNKQYYNISQNKIKANKNKKTMPLSKKKNNYDDDDEEEEEENYVVTNKNKKSQNKKTMPLSKKKNNYYDDDEEEEEEENYVVTNKNKKSQNKKTMPLSKKKK